MNQTMNEFLQKHELIEEDDHILVAVSGGPDSMALLHYLYKRSFSFAKLSVAHVEHGLRGEASLRDMELVKTFCEKRKLSFYYFHANVHKVKEEKCLSTQEAARVCRYEFFEKLMKEIDASKLAMAHHGDDQIETMLMRQVRGSVSGLRGIPVKRAFGNGQIIRPFLSVDKQEILDYCKREKVAYTIDKSNESDDYVRNRFRHHVLPFLKKENGNVHETFQRQSEWFQKEDSYLQALASEEIKKVIVEKKEDKVTINLYAFLKIAEALQRRALHLILSYLSKKSEAEMTSQHVEQVLFIMKSEAPSSILHLPKGLVAERVYEVCEFYYAVQEKGAAAFQKARLEIPGMIQLVEGKISARIIETRLTELETKNNEMFYADLDKIITPIIIRSRKPGDKIAPLGLNGTKKLKDIFIEEKVHKRTRDDWPILVDGDDELLWIPLLKRSNRALIDEKTKKVLVISYEKK